MDGIERLDSRPYAIVEFPDGVQLVAAKWITGETGEMTCSWPNFTSNTRYDQAVKNLEKPNGDWKTYPVKNIVAYADSFEKGKEKLREAENFSDVNSGYDTEVQKRIRRQRASKKKLRMDNYFMGGSSSESNSSGDETSKNMPYTKVANIPVPPQPPVFFKSPNASTKVQKIYSPLSITMDSSQTSSEEQSKATEFEKYTRKSLSELRFKINSILETQKEILKELKAMPLGVPQSISSSNSEDDLINQEAFGKLPVKTKEELRDFEEHLQKRSFREFVVNELRKLGGHDLKSIILIMMPKILSNELAQEFSWIGGKGKTIFSTLQITKVILDTARLHQPAATDTDIAVPIKNWLRHAKERAERLKNNDNGSIQ
ncbi:uncharacterized protein LOC129004351 [Macrosteles quadrilineatus]|uniref:uncharacterized protein LOC129004351 n=1 Tax=Macrosteles quadrilineatus TaxID=74068 RepID=UPI0023E27560|nr:uncharacterized protein LOC129004351 [Macrosteles quadrilineatus]